MKSPRGARRIVEFISDGGAEGRMLLQIAASGGRATAQLDILRAAGLVENNYDTPINQPDRIRITEAGRAVLQASRASRP